MNSDFCELLRKFTDLSHIQRYNFPVDGLRMLRRQNVSEHTANVVFFSVVISELIGRLSIEEKRDMMLRALMHDFEEVFVSDVASDVKAAHKDLPRVLEKVAVKKMGEFFRYVGIRGAFLKKVREAAHPVRSKGYLAEAIVNAADLLDVAFMLREECVLGNTTAAKFLVRARENFHALSLCKDYPRVKELAP